MSIRSIMGNENFAKFAGGAAGAVYATTILKAAVRPAFIMADKKSAPETKKYTATKEFLYQALCLVIAVPMIPISKRIGFNLSKKFLSKEAELANKIGSVKQFEHFKKDHKAMDGLSDSAKQTMTTVNGSLELGSFVGSILGLTLVAPIISHKILHPIMHAIGIDKKDKKETPAMEKLQQPAFVEAHHKVNVNA